MTRLRLIPALIAALALTACGGGTDPASPSATPTPTSTIPTVDNIDDIKVTGKYLEVPIVEFKAPLAVAKTMSKVLIEGDGATVPEHGAMTMWYSGSNGRTGKVFEESYTKTDANPNPVPIAFPIDGVVAGLREGVIGKKVGSRVLVVMPGSAGYDEVGGNPGPGILVGDTLVFVVDIVATSLNGPEGTAVTPPADLPKVTEVNGQPNIEIAANSTPPTKLIDQLLIEGKGDKVTVGSAIFSRYKCVSWKTKEVVFNTYGSIDTGGLNEKESIPGFIKGLDQKKIGSRIELIIPPADAYPDGSNDPKIEAGDTLACVVDLLMLG